MINEICDTPPDPLLFAGAIFSDDRRCRFRLWRGWRASWDTVGRLLFVMLNPSSAGANVDDATVKKCMRYAKRWNYSEMHVVNVYPHISTDPKKLDRALMFAANLEIIREQSRHADRIVCAWGKHALEGDVRSVMLAMAGSNIGARRDTVALRRNNDGSPSHPLYLADAIEPVVYP